MSSWWRLIAESLGAGSGPGSWKRRAAVALGAEAAVGDTWDKKIVAELGAQSTQGSWTKRLVGVSDLGPGPAARSVYLAGSIAPAAEAEYEGPLDLVAGAVVAYGQRALSAAKRGTALYTIREDAGDTEQSFSSDATTGLAPVSAINTFLNGSDGFVTTFVDQSGNGLNTVQAVAADQVLWQASATGGRPGIVAAEEPARLVSGTFNFSGGATTIFVAAVVDVSAGFVLIELDGAEVGTIGFGSYYNLIGDIFFSINLGDGTYWASTETISSGAHILEVVAAADGTVSVWVDGVALTMTLQGGEATPLVSDSAAVVRFPAGLPGSIVLDGLVYSSALSAGNRLAIRQNIATYYGITLS